jgi:hypothetical protein
MEDDVQSQKSSQEMLAPEENERDIAIPENPNNLVRELQQMKERAHNIMKEIDQVANNAKEEIKRRIIDLEAIMSSLKPNE